MKVGGTQRRLDGALTFFGFGGRVAFSFCLSAADFRTLDSATWERIAG